MHTAVPDAIELPEEYESGIEQSGQRPKMGVR